MRRFVFCSFVFLLTSAALWAQTRASAAPTAPTAASPVGVWLNEEKDGRIEVYEQAGRLFGRIVWIDPAQVTDPKTGQPKTDTENPDPNLRSRPLMGLVILRDFTAKGPGKWEGGTIYDPNDGKTYRCLMALTSADVLSIRGYIGFSWIGRTTTWTRVR